jgi:pyruvate kinase
MNLAESEKINRRMALKIGINRFLFKHRGQQFEGQVRKNFRTVTDEDFNSVVDEMVAAGELLKLVGQKGGITLQQMIIKGEHNGN